MTWQFKASAPVRTLRKRQPLSPTLCGHKKKENPKRSTTILLYRWENKVDSRDNLPKSEVRSEPKSPKENLLSCMIPFTLSIYLPSYPPTHPSIHPSFPPSLSSWKNSQKDAHSFPLWPLLAPNWHLQTSGQLEAQFFHDGTHGSVMTNITFPIMYHHAPRKHLHGDVAHRTARKGRVGRKWQKVIIWEPAAMEDSDHLEVPFLPIVIETTNDCTFLLSELLSLMSISLQKLLQC